LFQSKTKKAVTVLNPVKTAGDIEEARVKHRFFKTVYPDKQSHLFAIGEGYRLIVPHIPYTPYNKLTINSPEFQKTLFRSAAHALKDCHDKEIVVIDLKTDNIYYDSHTEKSYLIDGGLSAPIGTPVDSLAFQKSNQRYVEQYKKEYWHIPPECWSVRPAAVLSAPKMDIYSLGVVMYDLLKKPTIEIQSLIDSCLKKDPNDRPTLEELISTLESSPEDDDRSGCFIM
jgi:serine/threonine protein kinase